MTPEHIILLGFQHVGKSTVGKLLAAKLQRPFIDLDAQIEQNYQNQIRTQQRRSCREIYQQHGDVFFRDCETSALRQVIEMPAAVIALGGGAPIRATNQELIKPHRLVHLAAAPAVIYARIMANGKPAYFPADQDPEIFFEHLWQHHGTIYTGLADLTIDNTDNPDQAAEQIFVHWSRS